MPALTLERLQEYRQQTFRWSQFTRLRSQEEAVEFVNQRGFVSFWTIKGALLPSLWAAVAGDRPVPNNHDDPAYITWTWKDGLLDKRRWYYGRLLRRRNTIISLPVMPYFYALSPNFGDYQNDYLQQYYDGELPLESRQIYEALLEKGPLDTLELRRVAHLTDPSSSRFNRALDNLQVEMKILPVGISPVGAWKYAFIYDIVPRYFPNLIEQCRFITEGQARQEILALYFQSVGAASLNQVQYLFGWKEENALQALRPHIESGLLAADVEIPGQPGPGYALHNLLE